MKDLISAIVNIFKYAGKFFTIIRNTFLNVIFIFVLGVVVFSFFSSSKQPEVTINKSSILRLDLYGNIVEERKILNSIEQILEDPLFGQSRQQETLLQDILDVIDKGSSDDNIKIILLNLKQMGRAGLNQLETIGEALETFKKSGKQVIAAEDYYTQTQYDRSGRTCPSRDRQR